MNEETAEIFAKLAFGCKFDFKRFRGDAEKVGVRRPSEKVTKPPSQQLKRKPEEADQSSSQKPKKKKSEEQEDVSDDEEGSSEELDDEEEAMQQSDDDEDSEDDERFTSIDDEDVALQLMSGMTSKDSDQPAAKQTLTKNEKKKKKKKTAEHEAQIKQEKINHTRNVHKIHVHGADVPAPVETFEELQEKYGISDQLLNNLIEHGYETPTAIQMQAIPVMFDRREVLSCAPTGSGKTAAFIIPILHHLKRPQKKGFRALVLAPTRELAKQIHQEFSRLNHGLDFNIKFIESKTTEGEKSESPEKCDVLVTTPNRLVYMLKQKEINLHKVEWLVVDESDKLFESGKTGFRDQLAAIYNACDSNNIRRALFSATFAHDVEEWCKLNLDNVVQVYIGARNAATHTIQQELVFVGSEAGKRIAMRNLIKKGFEPPVLIFVQSKERAKELFQELIYDDVNVDVIHADRTQTERDSVVSGFQTGKVWILICTELMGRGIDFKDVNLVINYDFPQSAISYIHRIGRTGRAGRTGKAVTYFTEDDAVNLRSIANVMREAGCDVPQYMLEMKRPSKKARKKLAKRVPKRDSIRTLPKADLEKAQRKKAMIKASKDGKSPKKNKGKKKRNKQRKQAASAEGERKKETGVKKHQQKIENKENSKNKSKKILAVKGKSVGTKKKKQTNKKTEVPGN